MPLGLECKCNGQADRGTVGPQRIVPVRLLAQMLRGLAVASEVYQPKARVATLWNTVDITYRILPAHQPPGDAAAPPVEQGFNWHEMGGNFLQYSVPSNCNN